MRSISHLFLLAGAAWMVGTANACSPLPRENECVLSSLRVSNKRRYVLGTIDRYGDVPFEIVESTPVWIDLRTQQVLPVMEFGWPLQDLPEAAPPSDYSAQVSSGSSTVTVFQDETTPIASFELEDGVTFDPVVDKLSYFYAPQFSTLYVLYARNSYWGGVQVTLVNVDNGTSFTASYPRATWNTDHGDAFQWTEGELLYYPDLQVATLHNSGAMCGQALVLFHNEFGVDARPSIVTPLFATGMNNVPVWTARRKVENSLSYHIDEWSSETYYKIVTVNISSGQVKRKYKIRKSDIDAAGNCNNSNAAGDKANGDNIRARL